ncbi:hypothetical protein DAPPUDRAFT_305936 [Daphnia pulex]|uniref:Uncharacterized protein n=1 Tax=Daphnia pulex TaxID=6669 RepID=E9HWJ7_DAPPU|nr:hypothetical protein DAPPUDRAFT_305936 [Daphnia pulex]|eukprot:EFX63885.1 hypothetical protein DAPPUDRAFT_305936 [Daphnia pulex]
MVSTSDPGMSLRRWLVNSVTYLSRRYVTDVKVATIGLPGNVWLVGSIFLWILGKKYINDPVGGRLQMASSSVGVIRRRASKFSEMEQTICLMHCSLEVNSS